MRPTSLLFLSALALAACDRLPTGKGDPAQAAHTAKHEGGHAHGPAAQSITHFTDRTELFVEFPALVVGAESPFAAHLTWLSDASVNSATGPVSASGAGFKPVTEGRVAVLLTGGGRAEERFEVDAPTSPGIFRPVAKPQHAGKRQLALRVEIKDSVIVHELGEVPVFPDQRTAELNKPKEEEDAGEISFLKEQQWKIDFATAPVSKRRIRDAVAATGTIRAAAGGEALLAAPASGLIAAAGPSFPRVGQTVKKGEVLAYLIPRLGGEADAATLELAVRRAELELHHAKHERERLQGLYAQEAVPERRVVEARNQEQLARAELESAQKRRAPYQGGAGGLPLRAPISGVLADVKTAPGGAIEASQPLFHIADLGRLWLEARIPESQLGRLKQPSGAWFRIDGFDETFELEVGKNAHLAALGGVVDKESRTVPLILEFDNPGMQLRVGLSAQVHVLTDKAREVPAAPVSAVLDDGGQAVVFVQRGGEAFERRQVVLGARDGDFVEVRTGLEAGERIVTLGAYDVRLAAAAPAAMGHGHAH
jgi:membrane fusion protein, heavy metal efflux system